MRNKITRRTFSFLFFLVFSTLLWSCDFDFLRITSSRIRNLNGGTITKMELPQTPIFESYPNYLLLTTTISRLLEEKNIESKVLGIVRKGDVWVIEKISGGDETGHIWCFVRQGKNAGWVRALNPILTFSSERAHYIAKYNNS